jgi:D-alanyl-D-alanine dipeptidase
VAYNNLEHVQPTKLEGEQIMRKVIISAAAMTAFLASAPANAIENYGPNKAGNQCFTPAHTQGRDLAFGTWGACPQPASVSAAPTHRKNHHR